MSFGLPPAGSTPAEEWSSKVLKAVDGALDQAGATASTGGFVDAVPKGHEPVISGVAGSFQSGQPGGLASSPNVQSIAAEAGRVKHSEGLTKDDLLKGLSGREQAAAQLAAAKLAIQEPSAVTPGIVPAKTSSGPVDATRPVASSTVSDVPPVIPVATGLTRTVDQVQEPTVDDARVGHAPTVDEKLSQANVLRASVPEVASPKQDSATLSSMSALSSTGHQNISQANSEASPLSQVMPTQSRVTPQPRLPDLMPSRNVPVDTPMVEGLPGGWIGSLKTSVPGTDREHPETTVYQDVVTGLDSVGQSAFNVIPQSIKDSINPNRPHPGPSILDQARSAIGQVHLPQMPNVHLPQLPDLLGHSAAENRSQAVVGDVHETRRTDVPSTTATPQANATDLLNQAKGMAQDLLSGTRSRAEEAYSTARSYADRATGSAEQGGSSVLSAPNSSEATALPLQETQDRGLGVHTAAMGSRPVQDAGAKKAVLPTEKSTDRSSSDHAIAPKGPGPELSATDGILDISGGGQSLPSPNVEKKGEFTEKPEGVASSTSHDEVVARAPTQEREVETQQSQEPQTAQFQDRPSAHDNTSTALPGPTPDAGLVSNESASPPDGLQSHSHSHSSVGIAGTSGAQQISTAASPAGFSLAPPLGVFTGTTPIASGASTVLSGSVPPAKKEAPVEVLPIEESRIPEPVLGRPAADPTIASDGMTSSGVNSTVGVNTSAPAIPSYRQAGDASQTFETEPEVQLNAYLHEDNRDAPSYPSSRDTSVHESIPTGRLDHPSAARMDSSASVTAVKHGHVGEHHHKDVETPHVLDTVAEKALPSPPAPAIKSEAAEVQDVTARSPEVPREKPAAAHAPATPTNTYKATTVPSNTSSRVDASQHQRTDSGVSTSSKKKGFFSKLKDKLHHDDK